MTDLTTTNVWLAILASVSVIELVMLLVAGVLAYKAYSRIMTTVDAIERVHIAPLRARVDEVLDEVEVITGKVRQAQDSMGRAFDVASGAGGLLVDTVRYKAWPVMGVLRGLGIAARVLMKKDASTPSEA